MVPEYVRVPEDFRFPVLMIGRDSSLAVARTPDSVTTCTNTAFRQGYYQGLIIIDSEGEVYESQNVERIGHAWRRPAGKLLPLRLVCARLQLRHIGQMTLPEVIELLQSRVGSEWYPDLQTQVQSVPELIDVVQRRYGLD